MDRVETKLHSIPECKKNSSIRHRVVTKNFVQRLHCMRVVCLENNVSLRVTADCLLATNAGVLRFPTTFAAIIARMLLARLSISSFEYISGGVRRWSGNWIWAASRMTSNSSDWPLATRMRRCWCRLRRNRSRSLAPLLSLSYMPSTGIPTEWRLLSIRLYRLQKLLMVSPLDLCTYSYSCRYFRFK